jgi:cell division protease FtsH
MVGDDLFLIVRDQYLPKEEYITTTEQLLDRMCMTFGGRAAEKIVFGKISTGAQNDLDQVTKMAYSMISVFGMSDKVGQISFYGMQNESFQKPFSDDTASMIDEEVRGLVNSQYERAQELLTERRDDIEKLAQALLEKEVLLKSDVERLIGVRPFGNDGSEDDGEHVSEAPGVEEKPSTEEEEKTDA